MVMYLLTTWECVVYGVSFFLSGVSPRAGAAFGKRSGQRSRILCDSGEEGASGTRPAGLLQERDHPSHPHEEPLGQT